MNERKLKILEAIINDYIITAEPIGSRTIAKKYDMGISSATIRNEMSDLEEMGFIIQPHASSGRIPSDKGYRLYVDRIMHKHELTNDETMFLKNAIVSNIDRIDFLIQETAKAIALMTNYTTIISEPKISKTKVKHLQLVGIDESTVLLVIISDSKAVANQTLRMQNVPDANVLLKISNCLNKMLVGVDLEKIDSNFINELIKELDEYGYIAISVIDSIIDSMSYEEDRQIYMSGAKNILAFPEFSDLSKARQVFHALEEKDMLITLLDDDSDENIKIVIGSENDIKNMQGCSIIKANYHVGEKNRGNIGIIGPTRMDYSQTVAVLNSIVSNLNNVISNLL